MLDHLSTVAHFTRAEDEFQLTHPGETWKSALVQTVCVPDLEHIRIPSKITRKEDCVANGVLTHDLRQQIEHQVEEAIRCAHLDITDEDDQIQVRGGQENYHRK